MSETRVHWTKEEKRDIALLSFKIRQNNSDITDVMCVRQAQEALLAEVRWRPFKKMAEVAFVSDAWRKLTRGERLEGEESDAHDVMDSLARARDHAESIYSAVSAPEYGPAAVPVQPEVKQWPAAIKPVVNPAVENAQPKALTVEDASIEQLMLAMMGKFLKRTDEATLRALVRDEVNKTLERRLPGVLAPDVPFEEPTAVEIETPVERKVLPKVALIGLNDKQKEIFRQNYSNQLDLHFLEGSEGGTRIKNTVSLMDLTIRTPWPKGILPSMKNVPNYVNASGLDSARTLIMSRFGISANSKH